MSAGNQQESQILGRHHDTVNVISINKKLYIMYYIK